MIARLWHGMTAAKDYDAYWAFLHQRAIPDYAPSPATSASDSSAGSRVSGRTS